jgi:hypothetical protein
MTEAESGSRSPDGRNIGRNYWEVEMPRLVRMDATGHSQLAEWTGPGTDYDRAVEAFRAELEDGYIGVWDHRDGTATQVRELPPDADLVILRKPIAGG